MGLIRRGCYESSPWLRAFVPGQVPFDQGMTALENGNYGAAAIALEQCLASRFLTAASFGLNRAVASAGGACTTIANGAELAADAAGITEQAVLPLRLRVGDRVFVDVSTGGRSRTLHPQVQAALDKVPQAQRAPWHGHCAEPGCLSQALKAGVNPAGGTSRAVNIGTSGRGHGTLKPTCSSCKNVLDQFGVKHD